MLRSGVSFFRRPVGGERVGEDAVHGLPGCLRVLLHPGAVAVLPRAEGQRPVPVLAGAHGDQCAGPYERRIFTWKSPYGRSMCASCQLCTWSITCEPDPEIEPTGTWNRTTLVLP
jgi:hypothetical protein